MRDTETVVDPHSMSAVSLTIASNRVRSSTGTHFMVRATFSCASSDFAMRRKVRLCNRLAVPDRLGRRTAVNLPDRQLESLQSHEWSSGGRHLVGQRQSFRLGRNQRAQKLQTASLHLRASERAISSTHQRMLSEPALRNAAMQACPSKSAAAALMSTSMRRTRSPCCARAASGHAVAPCYYSLSTGFLGTDEICA